LWALKWAWQTLWALKWAWQTVGVKVGVANFCKLKFVCFFFVPAVKVGVANFFFDVKVGVANFFLVLEWAWQTFFWGNR